MAFVATDAAEPQTFDAIFRLLDASSRDVIGPATPRPLVVPIRNEAGGVIGGLWSVSLFNWLHLQMLFVPVAMRGLGVGSALLATAEIEARARGCLGIYTDTFQAAAFYEKMGFSRFGALDDCPPGFRRLFFQKRLSGKHTA